MAGNAVSKKSKTPKHKPSWATYKAGQRSSVNARRKAEAHEKHLIKAKLRATEDKTGSRAKKSAIKEAKRAKWLAAHHFGEIL